MSSLMEDLATLESVDQTDAVEVAVNDDYTDALPPAPVPERDYRLRVTKWELDKKDGKLKLTDGKYPVILILESEVVEPVEFAGKRALSYERINTKPFERPKGSGSYASMLGDLTRSFDQTRHWSQIGEGISLLGELITTGTFRARCKWEGYDKDHFDNGLAALGGEAMATDEQKKKLRGEATLRGMKRFPALPDGLYAPVTKGPSGADVEARLRLGTIYPSAKEVKL